MNNVLRLVEQTHNPPSPAFSPPENCEKLVFMRILYPKSNYSFLGDADTWQKTPAQSQLLHPKEQCSSAGRVLPFLACTAQMWQNNQIYAMDLLSIHQPVSLCITDPEEPNPTRLRSTTPQTPTSCPFFLGHLNPHKPMAEQTIHLQGLGAIWLGRWVCYNGIKIQTMSYTAL